MPRKPAAISQKEPAVRWLPATAPALTGDGLEFGIDCRTVVPGIARGRRDQIARLDLSVPAELQRRPLDDVQRAEIAAQEVPAPQRKDSHPDLVVLLLPRGQQVDQVLPLRLGVVVVLGI